jgi:hypothetical protein
VANNAKVENFYTSDGAKRSKSTTIPKAALKRKDKKSNNISSQTWHFEKIL